MGRRDRLWSQFPSHICRNECPAQKAHWQTRRPKLDDESHIDHPPHAQAVPQRHSQPSSRGGGPPGGATASMHSPPGLAASSSAQLPDQLFAGHWPGHARCSTQHGGSDHRRPPTSKLEPTPPPLFPSKTPTRSQWESEGSPGQAAKPASGPATPPAQWATPQSTGPVSPTPLLAGPPCPSSTAMFFSKSHAVILR